MKHILYIVIFTLDSVANTVDTTKNAAASAVDRGSSLIGSAKNSVASTAQSTFEVTKNAAAAAVDTTRNVAGSVVEKGSSVVGVAKGIHNEAFSNIHFYLISFLILNAIMYLYSTKYTIVNWFC